MSSLPFDAQRTINWYVVYDETGQGKEPAALYATPGLKLFSTVGIGPIRGVYTSTNGRMFAISNNELYELSNAGTPTLRGTLASDAGAVTICENTTQMAICDADKIYIFTYATNAFATATIAQSPALTVTELDGYFIYNTTLGRFYISGLQDGLSWNSLDFATAESSPDGLKRVIGALGLLLLLGDRTIEPWYNSGDLEFPFDRQQGATKPIGCVATYSVVEVDNTIYWLGATEEGQGIVYKLEGYSPKRVSTFAIEELINKSTNLSEIRGFAYQEKGHTFYVLNGGELETSPVLDLSSGQWHERAYLEETGFYSQHKAICGTYAFGKHLVGDRDNANVYEMSTAYYDDAGTPIRSRRVFTHINNEGKRIKINTVEVDFERGVGLVSGQGSNPIAWIRTSVDGGRSWGPEINLTVGKIGVRGPRAIARKMGINEDLITFDVTITDPVRRAICGAYAT